MLIITNAYSLCRTLDGAKILRKEIAFLSAIKVAITKFTSVDRKLSQEGENSALKQILDNSIISEGVVDVFSLCGLGLNPDEVAFYDSLANNESAARELDD